MRLLGILKKADSGVKLNIHGSATRLVGETSILERPKDKEQPEDLTSALFSHFVKWNPEFVLVPNIELTHE